MVSLGGAITPIASSVGQNETPYIRRLENPNAACWPYIPSNLPLQFFFELQYGFSYIFRYEKGKVSVITCIFYLFILIDVFFDVESKSTIGFRQPHVVFVLWRVKINIKNLLIVKKKYMKSKNFLFNY